jgi:glutathione peroxidase
MMGIMAALSMSGNERTNEERTLIYDHKLENIDGEMVALETFRGKTLLIVNLASACGLTPQYAGLQDLYEKYNPRGLEILGFPCNQFGKQEPGTHSEIKKFASTTYGVTFPLFAKIEVNGSGAAELYRDLKGEEDKDIEWNFATFLVSKDGKSVKRFPAQKAPSELADEIDSLL